MLTSLDLCNEQLVRALEELIDVDREVPVGVHEAQEIEELGVVQEEKPRELEPLHFQVVVGSLVHLLVEGYQFGEDWDPILDGKVVGGLWVPEGAPHDSSERGASI